METRLLSVVDPLPIDVLNADSALPLLLLCEHASRAVPAATHLGVSNAVLNSHRGWDIGAEDLAREIATPLGAPLIIQRYSRLVIDANRPPGGVHAIPVISDGADISGNRALGEWERAARITEIFEPMNDAIDALFKQHPRRAAFSIHSFTPTFEGQARPQQAGFLSRHPRGVATALCERVAARDPDLILGVNEPYRIEDDTDWFIPVHAEPRNIAHCLIEVRNDEIAHPEGVRMWGDYLAEALSEYAEVSP